MVSPVINEQFYSGAFLVSKGDGFQSFDPGTILNSGSVGIEQPGGLVLAYDLVGAPTGAAIGTPTGNFTVGSLAAGASVEVGTYKLVATAATKFAVFDPNDVELGTLNTGTLYVSPEFSAEVVVGTTAAVAGDTYGVTFPAGDGNYVPLTATSPGPAAGVLYNRVYVPASGTANVTVVKRLAEVNASELQWDPSITGAGTLEAGLQATALAQLKALTIQSR